MPKCTRESIKYPAVGRRVIEAEFSGGNITGDGGVLLLREVDRLTKLTESVAAAMEDPRRPKSCRHDLLSLIRQRVYAIGCGYEDLNDHNALRGDIAMQTAVNRDTELAGSST